MEMEIFSLNGHQRVPTATVDYNREHFPHKLSAYAATLVPVSATNVSPNPPGLSSASAPKEAKQECRYDSSIQ